MWAVGTGAQRPACGRRATHDGRGGVEDAAGAAGAAGEASAAATVASSSPFRGGAAASVACLAAGARADVRSAVPIKAHRAAHVARVMKETEEEEKTSRSCRAGPRRWLPICAVAQTKHLDQSSGVERHRWTSPAEPEEAILFGTCRVVEPCEGTGPGCTESMG